MRKLAFVLALGFLSVPASAQSDYPRAELFGGFSFGSIRVKDPLGVFDHEPAEGFQAAIAVNVNRTLGIVADFGGLWGDLHRSVFSGGTSGGTFRTLQVFVGPRFTKRTNRITMFVHALPGLAQQRDTIMSTSFFFPPSTTTSTSYGFVVALGGGVDVNLGKRLAIRAVQVDYLATRFSTPLFGNFGSNVRVGVGVVFKFGGGS
jgi:peptidoglycan-associated lipoprotein